MLFTDFLRIIIASPLAVLGVLLGSLMIMIGCLTAIILPHQFLAQDMDLEAGKAYTEDQCRRSGRHHHANMPNGGDECDSV